MENSVESAGTTVVKDVESIFGWGEKKLKDGIAAGEKDLKGAISAGEGAVTGLEGDIKGAVGDVEGLANEGMHELGKVLDFQDPGM